MGTEIERKFLTVSDAWRSAPGISSRLYRQGYLSAAPVCTVRVRQAGDSAWLTIKGPVSGISRAEFEYPIPAADAAEMLGRLVAGGLVEKIRHVIPAGDLAWEVDEFLGENAGLIVAEIELPSAEADFPRPDWLGEEVTGDRRYYNSSLAKKPYRSWTDL